MNRLFCVIVLFLVQFSIFGQLNPITYHHEKDDLNCSLSCQENEMFSFNLVLLRGRNDALSGIKGQKDICFKEAFEQALYSIDNMSKTEKELNCCILVKFCTESLEPEHLLYLLTWDTRHDDRCGEPMLDFNIYRDDCRFIPSSVLFLNGL